MEAHRCHQLQSLLLEQVVTAQSIRRALDQSPLLNLWAKQAVAGKNPTYCPPQTSPPFWAPFALGSWPQEQGSMLVNGSKRDEDSGSCPLDFVAGLSPGRLDEGALDLIRSDERDL